ncbi:helix-turn-helix transcriptional regulator [Streptomyces sp. NPDC051173]|uniref:helix-turn-helix domain-containing protein n=1 Tax=Streptomyces sp. NPDC051173 TaxID=3155164 RepID=UPI00344E5CCA
MPESTDIGAGARIAAYRRLHHLTQRGLAEKAHVSYSLLTKVEAGIKPASASLIAACARALDVSVTALNGQPFAMEHTADRLDGPLSELRAALDNWDMPLEELPVRPLADVEDDVMALVQARRDANFAQLASFAPALINELVQISATASGHEAEEAHRLLAHVYRSAHAVAYGLGLTDLASLLLARMEFSAQRCANGNLLGLYRYMRARSAFTTGRHEVGRRIVMRAADELGSDVTAGDTGALCVVGNLHLRAAMLATRDLDEDRAREHLAEARRLAGTAGREIKGGVDARHVMSFGPTNVDIHAAAVEVELGKYGKALQLFRDVHFPDEYPPDRISHHWIDTARAQMWTGKNDAALASLLKARKAAPQQTKYHPSVRETVASLVRAARSAPETLTGYASWVGVPL